jgi:hypothetical protein
MQLLFAIAGWDVAINRASAAELVEGNGAPDGIILSEAATGPDFKDMGWGRFAARPLHNGLQGLLL